MSQTSRSHISPGTLNGHVWPRAPVFPFVIGQIGPHESDRADHWHARLNLQGMMQRLACQGLLVRHIDGGRVTRVIPGSV
jgi:hypothetical protein